MQLLFGFMMTEIDSVRCHDGVLLLWEQRGAENGLELIFDVFIFVRFTLDLKACY